MQNIWDWNTACLYGLITIVSLSFAGLSTRKIRIIEKNDDVCYKEIRNQYRINKVLFFISFIPLFFILILRANDIGGDLSAYLNSYLSSKNLSDNILSYVFSSFESGEPLFKLLVLTIGILSNWNETVFIIILSIIPLLLAFLVLLKEGKEFGTIIPLFFYICFVYFRSFSMLRQTIALMIVLYAYTFLKQRKNFRFFIFTLIAIGFHYTAIIAIPLFFICSKSKLSTFYKLLIGISFLCFLFIGNHILETLFYGFDSKYSNIGNENVSFGFGNLLIRLPMFLIVLLYRGKMIKYNANIEPYTNIYLMDIFIAQTLYVNPLFERFTSYSSIALIFVLPALYRVITKESPYSKIIFLVLFIAYWFYILYFFTYINPYYIMPYEFSGE